MPPTKGPLDILHQDSATFGDLAGLVGLDQLPYTTGTVYFVSSGAGSDTNSGTDKDNPLATIDAAVNKCTASVNDVIIVMPGHAESIAAAAGIDLDAAGISVIGLGNGANRPTITFATSADADVDVDAANIRIRNLRFVCNIANQTAMIDVNSTACIIEDCEFLEGSATGLSFIDVNGGSANACDDLKILNSYFYAPTAGNMDRAIELGEVADSVEIAGNTIIGDFDDAGIHNPTGKVLTHLQIHHNIVHQLLSGNHAIELVSACTGALAHNWLYADAFATLLDPGSLKCTDNWGVDAIDEAGYPVPAVGDSTDNYVGTNSANNDAATSSVAANEDGSVLERLEQIQEAVNNGTGTALGSNRSLLDELLGAGFNYNRTNYLAVTPDLSSATWNTVASHELFTVTGLVRVRIAVTVTTEGDDTSGNTSTIQLGVEGDTDAFIAATEVDDLAAGELWYDATPTTTTDTLANAVIDAVVNGSDIGYEIAAEAATAGVFVFHCWWEGLDATGAVAAGAGGSL